MRIDATERDYTCHVVGDADVDEQALAKEVKALHPSAISRDLADRLFKRTGIVHVVTIDPTSWIKSKGKIVEETVTVSVAETFLRGL